MRSCDGAAAGDLLNRSRKSFLANARNDRLFLEGNLFKTCSHDTY
jgi:hypothetical protein